MTIKKSVNGRDLIKTLLELTGHDYCELVKGVTVSAYVDDSVTVTVEMLAIDVKNKDE
jgi:hypothetical protein